MAAAATATRTGPPTHNNTCSIRQLKSDIADIEGKEKRARDLLKVKKKKIKTLAYLIKLLDDDNEEEVHERQEHILQLKVLKKQVKQLHQLQKDMRYLHQALLEDISAAEQQQQLQQQRQQQRRQQQQQQR